MSQRTNTKNTKRLIAPITYMVSGDDDNLDIDTSGGVATLYIANIQQSGALLIQKKIYVNDVTGNAGTNNIIINTIDGDTINNVSALVLDVDGISAEITIADRTRYMASLNTDGGGGGGGGHIIQQDAVSLPTRPKLNFKGVSLLASDDVPNNSTDVEFTGDVCTLNMEKSVTLGADVVFDHPSGSGNTIFDAIDTGIEITRDNTQAIYNLASEPSVNYSVSPIGTLWNWSAWGDLTDIESRIYVPFYEALNYSIGNNVVGAELVMKDTINNKYYKFNFTYWASGQSQSAHTSLPFSNPTTNVVITIGTRTYTYNLALDLWDNLDAPASYVYGTIADAIVSDSLAVVSAYQDTLTTFYIYAIVSGVAGNSIVTSVDVDNGYNFPQPTLFGGANAGAGGFTYTRNLITLDCDGTIHFHDGTSMDTAPVDNKKIILVDRDFGNDATAVKYNMFKPYATIEQAWQSAVGGDTIWLNPSNTPYAIFNDLFYKDSDTLFVNYHISAGATLQAFGGGHLIYNRFFIDYVAKVGGSFVVGDSLDDATTLVNIGKIMSVQETSGTTGVLEIRGSNFVVDNGVGITNGVVLATLSAMTTQYSPYNNVSITGDGNLDLGNMTIDGAFAGAITIDVETLKNSGFNIGQGSRCTLNIKANKIIWTGIVYIDNPQGQNYGDLFLSNRIGGLFTFGTQVNNGLGVTAFIWEDFNSKATFYNIQGGSFNVGDTLQDGGGTITANIDGSIIRNAPSNIINIEVNELINTAVIFALWTTFAQMNVKIKRYRAEKCLEKEFWNYNGNPYYPVVSTIHIDDFVSVQPVPRGIFFFAGCTNLSVTTNISGNYKYTSTQNGGHFIQLQAEASQYINFNGNAILKNSSLLFELTGYWAVTPDGYPFSRITIDGDIQIENLNEYLLNFSSFLVTASKVKLKADVIANIPNQPFIILGAYNEPNTELELDIENCQIVNIAPVQAYPIIMKGFTNLNVALPTALPIQIYYDLTSIPPFQNGDVITNGLGASGVVVSMVAGSLFVNTIIGVFGVGEVITGSISLATGDVTRVRRWGILRLKNAVIIGSLGDLQPTTQGAWEQEPMQVYSAYANKNQLNMLNTITGNAYRVDADITSNNF